MLSLRARLFVIISLIVLFVLGISILLIVSRKNKPATTPTSTAANIETASDNNFNYEPNYVSVPAGEVPQGATIKPITQEQAGENYAQQLAKIFFERYNSYSTDNNFENIKEVQSLVTPELWQSISAKMKTPSASKSFVGSTTKVIGSNLAEFTDSKAVVQLQASVEEEKNGATTKRQQDATVELAKKGNTWLVSKFGWVK